MFFCFEEECLYKNSGKIYRDALVFKRSRPDWLGQKCELGGCELVLMLCPVSRPTRKGIGWQLHDSGALAFT